MTESFSSGDDVEAGGRGVTAPGDALLFAALGRIGSRQPYGSGESIAALDGEAGGLFVVLSGGVRLYRVVRDGRELSLAVLNAGDMLEPGAIHPTLRANCFLDALEVSVVQYVPAEDLRRLRLLDPAIAGPLDRRIGVVLRRLLAEISALP